MKQTGITDGPYYTGKWHTGAWVVKAGPYQYDQTLAIVGENNPYVPNGSAEGNATLFAASFEMLEALKQSRDMIASLNLHPAIEGKIMETLTKAINNAEGNK